MLTELVAGMTVAGCAFGAARLYRHRRACRELLPAEGARLVESSPLVSILIPARNEEEIVEACVKSALAQDYPRFEVIVCDDDSTDRTGEILDRLSDGPPRLRVVHRRGPPPPGWVGKNFALHCAQRESKGDWILTLDADCEIAPEALRAAMARALAPEDGVPRALVSALPDVDCGDLASRMMMPAFGVWLALAMPMHEVNDARKRTALAAGGFLLVDRQALDAIGGYERLAPHIVEDVLTARLVKSTGRRIELFIGGRCLSTRMYVGWSELWEGITKNAFAAVDFRPAIAASALAVILTFAVLPSAVLAAWAVATVAGIPIPILTPVALALFGAAAAILAALHAAIALELRFSPAFGLLAAPAHLVFAAALATSALRATRGAGVSWKGRRYYGAGVASPSDKLLT